MNKFAITYTVKNEAALLPDAIAYHLAIGCELIIVFFDGTTDNTRELVSDLPRVVCFESVEAKGQNIDLEWIKDIDKRWHQSMDVRKRINTMYAADYARQKGIDWIINIDPDEMLVLTGNNESAPVSDGFFEVSQKIDQILVPNVESVSCTASVEKPFTECIYFLNRFFLTESVWRSSLWLFRKFIKSPKAHAWFDFLFYRIRFMSNFPRLMKHPLLQYYIPTGFFLGYSNHKAFIRTSCYLEFKFNIHKWEKIGRSPNNLKKGILLHYDLPNPAYLKDKFSQRPPAMLVKEFYVRHELANIARELDFAVIQRFYENNIAIIDGEKLKQLLQKKIIRKIDVVSNFMQSRKAN